MPRGLGPVEIKVAEAEPPVRPDFQIDEVAEVVTVEFQQIGQDRLLLQRGRHDFDFWLPWFVHFHSRINSVYSHACGLDLRQGPAMTSVRRSVIVSVLFTLFGGPALVLVYLPWLITRFRLPS